MSINKVYTIESLVQSALEVVKKIPADNIGSIPVFGATWNDGYRWGTTSNYIDRSYTMVTSSDSFKVNAYLYTSNTIPDNLKKSVAKATVESDFKKLLNDRGFTKENFQGKLVSVRTVQAIADTVAQFVVARYQLWLNAGGTSTMVLYDSSKVSYPAVDYNFKVKLHDDVVYKDEAKVTTDNLETLMGSVVSASLASLKVKRQPFRGGYVQSSKNCSCCSSSCSSSSCSSSSCSSSCSCSSIFIAYMKLS